MGQRRIRDKVSARVVSLFDANGLPRIEAAGALCSNPGSVCFPDEIEMEAILKKFSGFAPINGSVKCSNCHSRISVVPCVKCSIGSVVSPKFCDFRQNKPSRDEPRAEFLPRVYSLPRRSSGAH